MRSPRRDARIESVADVVRTTNILSRREVEIAKLAAGGSTCKEIAERLYISTSTVKTHLIHIYQKLGVRNRAQLTQVLARSAENQPFG
jgi:DNA-binding NarL/FixJ family response regulator